MLRSQGAIRLQFSVYEVNNTQRVINNIKTKIVETYSKLFTGADSVMIFNASKDSVEKFGNAIHRDADVVYLWSKPKCQQTQYFRQVIDT